MINIAEIGQFESFKLLRQLKRNNLSILVDIGNKNNLTAINLGRKKTLIPSSFELLHLFIKHDQKTIIKTPKAQYYTAKSIGVGLVTSDQEAWVNKRKQVKGLFNSQQLNSLMDNVSNTIHLQLKESSCRKNGTELFGSIAISVIGYLLFDTFSIEDGNKIRKAVNLVVEPILKRIISPLPFFVDPFNKITSLSRNELFEILSRNIEMARISEKDNLIKEYYPTGNCVEDISNLLLAGYETISNTLAWLFHELGKNANVKKRLEEELRAVSGFERYHDLLLQIPYSIACISEVLRLYPPGWIMSRTSIENFLIDNIEVPANTNILLSPYLFHRLNKYWNAPNQFDPLRFLDSKIPVSEMPFYFPFGIGLRSCIGERLAQMEMYLILLSIFCKYDVQIESKDVFPKAHITLRPSGNIIITLNKKENGKKTPGI